MGGLRRARCRHYCAAEFLVAMALWFTDAGIATQRSKREEHHRWSGTVHASTIAAYRIRPESGLDCGNRVAVWQRGVSFLGVHLRGLDGAHDRLSRQALLSGR